MHCAPFCFSHCTRLYICSPPILSSNFPATCSETRCRKISVDPQVDPVHTKFCRRHNRRRTLEKYLRNWSVRFQPDLPDSSSHGKTLLRQNFLVFHTQTPEGTFRGQIWVRRSELFIDGFLSNLTSCGTSRPRAAAGISTFLPSLCSRLIFL